MKDHPHLEVIRKYYEGCSTANVEMMMSVLTSDVTHYFVNYEPLHGADTVANFWLQDNTEEERTIWTVDHAIVEDDEAVIEWTEHITFSDGTPPTIIRGAEWFQFRNGKIAEIRAYHRYISGQKVSELIGFPYAERGYPTFDTNLV